MKFGTEYLDNIYPKMHLCLLTKILTLVNLFRLDLWLPFQLIPHSSLSQCRRALLPSFLASENNYLTPAYFLIELFHHYLYTMTSPTTFAGDQPGVKIACLVYTGFSISLGWVLQSVFCAVLLFLIESSTEMLREPFKRK